VTEQTMAADLGRIGGLESAGLPTETVISADGTPITFERCGEGPPLVLIGGGLNNKEMWGKLRGLLSDEFTVLNYDRRGRGQSGDRNQGQYTVDLEIADLEAVIGAAGEPCFVFSNCTGGMIAVHAAARGVPMAKLGMYEPPFAAPKVPDGYMDQLKGLIAAGRRGDAVTLFFQDFVGFPDEVIERLSRHPIWEAFEAQAPTLIYDCTLSIDNGSIPFDLLPAISVPTLVVDGGDSPPWILQACETIARHVPGGRHFRVEGESHLINQEATAPLLKEFFLS
jgi:acyltransferase